MGFFSKLRKSMRTEPEETGEEDYVELDTEKESGIKQKVIVRPYSMEDFSDIKEILDSLRDGNIIALINIRPLKDKDLVELKRAINKLKKTCDAINGDVAGFGDDYIVATPAFARIERAKSIGEVEEPTGENG